MCYEYRDGSKTLVIDRIKFIIEIVKSSAVNYCHKEFYLRYCRGPILSSGVATLLFSIKTA